MNTVWAFRKPPLLSGWKKSLQNLFKTIIPDVKTIEVLLRYLKKSIPWDLGVNTHMEQML